IAVLTKLTLSEEETTQYMEVKQNVLAELENLRKQ
ncbi:MAG TPA: lactate dehydrogenase, partial [Lactobacillus sp.]|nr:lactate dehydrogenase [Lactobacillus sp.]